ncbi:ABC transporter ATP-binding protein [Candidatus Entotheonella palauensis]|uniref:ABC transporter ATP-binding protein n=1 Tax=Candidatus Entotheonella palauensis TaxID=93172 RepID=UPI0015C43BE9|nr:ABC transporter ATP-binding protein [Candidatus Entotheonella palauensis]
MSPDILQVRNLRVHYHTPLGAVQAVDDVSFALKAGERFGLVGESGSGKTTLAMALLRMIKPPGRIEAGEVWLDGQDVMALSDEEMRALRLSGISLVTQGSMNSLNPVIRIRKQLTDGMQDHGEKMSRRARHVHVHDLLERVGLEPQVAGMYPHELSGGMKQRVCIAMAISMRPKVIIADEPTSALDVVVQMQVMETLRRAQEEVGAAVILVGHDMGLMAQFVERVGVMYAGKLAEVSPVNDIFKQPLHPYAQLLIERVPSLEEKGDLDGIPGLPPSLLDRPAAFFIRDARMLWMRVGWMNRH